MAKSLHQQITDLQEKVWEVAEQCNESRFNARERIFEQGLITEETKCLTNIFNNDSKENLKEYLELLIEMKIFYSRIVSNQKGMVA